MPQPPFRSRADPSRSRDDRFRFILDRGLADLRSKLLSAFEQCPQYDSCYGDASDDDHQDGEGVLKNIGNATSSRVEHVNVFVKDLNSPQSCDPQTKSDDDGGDDTVSIDSTRRSKATDGRSMSPTVLKAHHLAEMIHSSRILFMAAGLRNWRRYQEVIGMVLICSNSIWMGWQLQYHAEFGTELPGSSAVDLCFCIAFVLEMFLRISADGCAEFWKGPDNHWNIFDAIVVSIMVIEDVGRRVLGDVDSLKPVPALRVLRMLRVIRILRAVRLFRALDFFRSGRLLIMSIMKTWTTLFWTMLILLAMVYVIALIISYGTLPHCVGGDSHSDDHVSAAPEYRDVCEHFGTVWKSCVSLYQAMLGGIPWSTLYSALEVLDVHYALVLSVAITFNITILHNVISAIFVCQVIATSDVEKQDSHYEDQIKKRTVFMKEMVENFHQLDVNKTGGLCREEVKGMFLTMGPSLASMDLDINTAETLFDLLDADGSGLVQIDEFVVGCLKMQGKARAVDLERVSRDVQDVLNILKYTNGMSKSVTRLFSEQTERFSKEPRMLANDLSKFGSNNSLSDVTKSPTNNYSRVARLRQQKRVQIDKVEMRAMLLSELEDVVGIIQSACVAEMWTDASSCEALSPKTVNLYHYMFHVISPATAATQITVSGLMHGRYEEGDVLTQINCDGRLVGQAQVSFATTGTEVQVMLTKGQLCARSSNVGADCNVMINGHDCGIPESISHKDSISYKELLPSNATRPDWFCTHWWGESIVEFVDCCRAHARARRKDAYWVCAYANRQHDLGLDVGDDPEESSFRRSMRLAEGVLLVLDKCAVPFQRIWCDYELYKNVCDSGKMLDIITFKDKPRLLTEGLLPGEHDVEKTQRERKFPLQLLSKGAQLCLELGNATVEQDKVNILNSMGRDPKTGIVDGDLLKKNVDRANKALRSYFALAAWPQALKRGLVRNFTFGEKDDEEIVKLPDILAEDEDRKRLQLSLSSIEEVDDIEMGSIAKGLPNAVKDLQLSFENCCNITDVGVSTLAERLHQLPLQKLRLDFVSCGRLTDRAVHALGMNLPKTLTDVRLDFAFCSHITKAGVSHLAADLPKSVKHFIGTFRGTICDEDFDSLKKLKKLL